MTSPNHDDEREERLAEERLLLLTQSIIQRELNKRGLKYRDLARRLGVSEARISQLLGDDAPNLTVRTVARILYRLGEAGVFMTENEVDQIVTGNVDLGSSAWVFAASGEHIYTGEDVTEIVSEAASTRPSMDDWPEWMAAEAAAAGRRRVA
jgi:transcriptional regulator with XRE-family HTH domain